jgi:folate-dependent tRNA-U54 methylase TrmFO/GidA
VTGTEIAINVAPQGGPARLWRVKVVKDTPAHVSGGASLLVAAR